MINYTDVRYSFEDNDFVKNVLNDIAVISQNEALLQTLLMRILIPKGSYSLNPNLGSEMYTLTRDKVTNSTKDRIQTIIKNAIKPEIDAGNIEDNVEVEIDSTKDKINLKITVQIVDGDKEQINLIIQ